MSSGIEMTTNRVVLVVFFGYCWNVPEVVRVIYVWFDQHIVCRMCYIGGSKLGYYFDSRYCICFHDCVWWCENGCDQTCQCYHSRCMSFWGIHWCVCPVCPACVAGGYLSVQVYLVVGGCVVSLIWSLRRTGIWWCLRHLGDPSCCWWSGGRLGFPDGG